MRLATKGGVRGIATGGGSVDVRLPRDVFTYKPTVVTVMLGMNDGRYRAYDEETFNVYATGMKNIVKATKAALPGARVWVAPPPAFAIVAYDAVAVA